MLPLLSAVAASLSTGALITFPAGPRSIARLGDIDGDGCDEFAVGDVQRETLGCAYVLSGKSGKLLATATGPFDVKLFGCSVAPTIDYDGDGVRDFAVSAPGTRYRPDPTLRVVGAVFVCSGKNGNRLARFSGRAPGDAFGVELASIGDVDGDGNDELLVGSPGMGAAYVLSGKNGKELRVVGDGDSRTDFGEAVAAVGDVDADGVSDFAVGAPAENIGGRVHLYSGKDGKELRALVPAGSSERLWFGSGLSSAGDLDADGKPDMLVGTDLEQYEFCARVYSSASGKVLLTIRQSGNHMFDHFGAAVAMLGDANGDGTPDYLIADTDDTPEGSDDQARGSIVLASGKNGATLYQVFGKQRFDRLGDSLAACGDLDGDGVPDFVAKAARSLHGTPCWLGFSGKDGKELWQFDPPQDEVRGPTRDAKR